MDSFKKVKASLALIRSPLGRKALVYYLIARALRRPLEANMYGLHVKFSEDDTLQLASTLYFYWDTYRAKYGVAEGEALFMRTEQLLRDTLRILSSLASATDAPSKSSLSGEAIVKTVLHFYYDELGRVAVGPPTLDEDRNYIDFRINYFGRATYAIGVPVNLTRYGVFIADADAAPKPSLKECRPMSPECPYYVGELKGASVLDVGGFIGDSALYFYALGAEHVKVYEPFFYEAAGRNLRINGLPEDVEPYAVGARERVCADIARGGNLGATSAKSISEADQKSFCANGRSWQEVLDKDYDLVKVDCEGCEQYLVNVPCEHIRRGYKWVFEEHEWAKEGLLRSLTQRFQSCGFNVKYWARVSDGRLFMFYAWLKGVD